MALPHHSFRHIDANPHSAYAGSMSLDAIKSAILELSEEDRAGLELWLSEAWDRQIERDFSPGGAAEKILAEVDAQIESGQIDRFKVTRPGA